METLTPAYAVLYRLNNVQGNSECTLDVPKKEREKIDYWDTKKPFLGTANQAIKMAEKFIEENPTLKVWVRQYGFMERGLRTGEKLDMKNIFEYNPIGGFKTYDVD